MARPAPMSLAVHLARLPDPRVYRTRRHALVDSLLITVRAVICGADDRVAIARFGRAKRRWFRRFLALPHTTVETVDADHGRLETRRAWAADDLARLVQRRRWQGLRSVVRVDAQRTVGAQTTRETRYSMSSRPLTRRSSRGSFAATGALKMTCAGSWTSPCIKTTRASAPAMPPRTSPRSTTSR